MNQEIRGTQDEVKEIIAQHGKANYVRGVKANRTICAKVEAETAHRAGLEFKARVYMVASGEDPMCPEGKIRPYLGLELGWGYCARGKECVCLSAHRSATTSAGRLGKNVAAKLAATTTKITIDDGTAAERLLAFIAANPKNYSSLIAEKDPEVYAWVMQRSVAHVSESAKFSENCYVAIHGHTESICARGNKRKFYDLAQGYEGCCETNAHCACRRSAQSLAITESQANLSEEDRSLRAAKQKATLVDLYGVEYAGQIPEGKVKAIATNQERYGADHPMQNAEQLKKHGDIFEKKYGVRSPGMSVEMQEKGKLTNLDRYGAETTMHLAREGYRIQTGFENPFNDPANQQKARDTMMVNHGVYHALQNSVIYGAMQDRTMAEHGVANQMQRPEIVEKLRASNMAQYNRPHWNQVQFTDENLEILNDAVLFAKLFDTMSLRDVAAHLGTAYDTARKYCYRHGVPLPKSSYETSIKAFIEQCGIDPVDIQQGNRSIIKPFELDFVIEKKKLAIEFNGLYYHRHSHIKTHRSKDELESKDYHRNKLIQAEAAGYRLITIFEDEWVHRQDIVKSRLRHALGASGRGPGGRQCAITAISAKEAHDFLETYHIQGGGAYGFANYGAYFENRLTAVMTFSRGRMGVGNGRMELLRFATDGQNIPGIADRLFKTFLREHDPVEIVSFADRRWSQGGLYRKLGFVEENDGSPGYFYIDCNRILRLNRMKAQKSKIKNLVEDGESKTEKQIMHELAFEIIYDCGSYLFRWEK